MRVVGTFTVLRSNRIGYTKGCWWISNQLAKKLTGGRIPRVGHEICIGSEPGQMGMTRRAFVENRAGHMILRDENGVVDVREKDDRLT